MSEKHQLDVQGLLCPMPVIRTQNRVKQLGAGDILEVTCSDPGVKQDLPSWCRINGHEVLAIREEKGVIIVDIKVEGRS